MRLLRGAVTAVGLGLLGLFGLVEVAMRRRDAHSTALVAASGNAGVPMPAPGPTLSSGVSRIRTGLGVLGVALASYGAYLGIRTIPATSYLAIALWLAAAVILHDTVLVPAVSLLRGVALHVGRRLSAISLALVEGAFVVGGVLSLVAVPEIWAKHLGPANPSVLPGSYGLALLLTWLILAVLAAGSVVVSVLSSRQADRRRELSR